MEAKPMAWGTGSTHVWIDPNSSWPIKIMKGGEEETPWYDVEDATQLIVNLQAAIETYEEEYG